MSSFVEEAFYVEPPKPDASPEEWNQWIEAEKKAAAVAKRKHTMSLKAEPENVRLWNHGAGMPLKGGDGVYRQSEGFIGFQATGVETAEVIAICAATQDRHFQARGKKGNRAAQRQSNAKVRKRNKRLRLVK